MAYDTLYDSEMFGYNFAALAGAPVVAFGDEEYYRPFYQWQWDMGVRRIRIGGTWFIFGQIYDSLFNTIDVYRSIGNFHIILGITFPRGNPTDFVASGIFSYTGLPFSINYTKFPTGGSGLMTPSRLWDWKINFELPIAILAHARTNRVNVWSLGNEEENIRGAEPVVSLTASGGVVTVTFAAPHFYKTGDTILIAGATPTTYNSVVGGLGNTVTRLTDTTLTYTPAVAPPDGSATGANLSAQMTGATYYRIMKEIAVIFRASCPNFQFIVSCTGNIVTEMAATVINPGVDLDYLGLQTYGDTNPLAHTSFYNIVKPAIDGLGPDKLWLTEWNCGVAFLNSFLNTKEKALNDAFHTRMLILKQLGYTHVYNFMTAGSPVSNMWTAVDSYFKPVGGPVNNFYSQFLGKKRRAMIETTTPGTVTARRIWTPINAMKRPKGITVDRGKAIDFKGDLNPDGRLVGVFPSSFTTDNLKQFTIAARVYIRNPGAAGRIFNGVNAGFCEIFTDATHYNAQVAKTSSANSFNTNSTSMIAPILFKWHCIFVTWDDNENSAYRIPHIYVDSRDVTGGFGLNTSNRPVSAVGQSYAIGNRVTGTGVNGRAFGGIIDDFFIYRRVFTPQDMNNFVNGLIPAQYILGSTMNEASGGIVEMIGPGAQPATLTGTAVIQGVDSYTSP